MSNRERIASLAKDMLILSRNTLLVNLRFLDCALSMFEFLISEDGFVPGTNIPMNGGLIVTGKHIIYEPMWVLSRYRSEKEAIVRDYLHMVFHCVFHHAFVSTLLDTDLWDLACDIAVEAAIEDLNISSVRTSRGAKQTTLIGKIRQDVKLLTAEKIYAWLQEQNYPEDRIAQMREPFKADEHHLWYMRAVVVQLMSGGASGDESGSGDDAGNGTGSAKSGSGEAADDSDSGDGGKSEESEGYDTSASSSLAQAWADIAQRMQTDLETFSRNRGHIAGGMMQNLRAVTREKYDYSEFLRKFSVLGEVMKVNEDEFDYIFYTYGMKLYGKMPLIEPLEYKEVKRIKEFVIAIDTSGSVQGDIVQTFLQKTYNILKQQESFFTKINLHIIQCDAEIQEDHKITCQEEFDEYLKTMKIRGLGGTDFRPVFDYVERLRKEKEFVNLKGLIYFTDGYGTFPERKPDYHTAFVFVDDEYNNPEVPVWAIRLVLQKEEI